MTLAARAISNDEIERLARRWHLPYNSMLEISKEIIIASGLRPDPPCDHCRDAMITPATMNSVILRVYEKWVSAEMKADSAGGYNDGYADALLDVYEDITGDAPMMDKQSVRRARS